MATSKINHISLFLLSILLLSLATISKSDEDCVYTLYVRTGSIIKGGTDSKISLTLYTRKGEYINIPNIELWGGLMEPGHDYFERGNTDIFSGRGYCLKDPVCKMDLTSDGTGWGHGWFVHYVEVTSAGKHKKCGNQYFDVEQWLATDTSPYNLTAIRDNCHGNKFSYTRLESKTEAST
ncbi:hypothetical protein MKW98_023291 [Papaver atlanticum]|uniref:PLAT domain-containing protein n=1 Tax=Papaver atlanticum TaxID=357466 RepID=A0AAD4XU54_9MAGN|nr:hypothetical protein MKW98_023291 [Papaver atlanticum]